MALDGQTPANAAGLKARGWKELLKLAITQKEVNSSQGLQMWRIPMTEGIIQKVFDRKTKRLGDYWSAFAIEELKHELVLELSKELDSYPFDKSIDRSTFKQWLIGDN